MNIMMKLLKDLTPLNRVFCSAGYDHAVSYLQKLLPFRVIGFQKEDNHNGWVIPPRWEVREAKILRDGKVLYDGKESPLGVISLSTPFQGKVGLEELKRHLFYDHRYEDAIPYHFRLLYRPWARDWGFCVPRRLFDRLGPGDYEVIIETEEEEGDLKILEYTHKGALNDTIVFAAHLDHPGMANDGLSGCAVGVELFRRLLPKKTKFSYKLFLHQEIIGSQYYLLRKGVEKGERLAESIFLEMLGSRTPLALQASRAGNTMIEQALAKTLEEEKISPPPGGFRQHRRERGLCVGVVRHSDGFLFQISVSGIPHRQRYFCHHGRGGFERIPRNPAEDHRFAGIIPGRDKEIPGKHLPVQPGIQSICGPRPARLREEQGGRYRRDEKAYGHNPHDSEADPGGVPRPRSGRLHRHRYGLPSEMGR